MDLSTLEGESYVLHEAENQGAAGPAPGRLHGAPRNRLAGYPGRNVEEAHHHRNNPVIYRGVGEGAAASGQVRNAFPGEISHDGGHEGHAIVGTVYPGQRGLGGS